MVRATALGLTALTGFSGLVYEVAWQKYVATLLGSHSEATAAVLALFLGGLSLGYAVFGRVTRRLVDRAAARGTRPRLLLAYGVVEAGIGVHALVFPWLFAGARALSLAIPHEVSGLGFALDVALVGLLILPPTVLMGGTIPLLTQALSRSLSDATRLHALVYATNTTGAFLGALIAGFVLLPQLGLQTAVLGMGGINLFAGASFALLGLVHRGVLGEEEPGPSSAVSLGALAWVALASGFAAMALQTVLIRLGGLAIGSSEFTFSMVVAVFVLCIAVGSFVVSALPRIPRGLLVWLQVALVLLLVALYAVVADAPYWTHVLRSAFRDEPGSFYLYYAVLFVAILGVLAVPIGLSGATLPLIFHELRREFGGLGSAAGRLYAWNTAGSLLGALLGGYLLLFWLDLDEVYALAVAAVLASAGLLAVRLFGWPRLALLALVPLVLGLTLLPRWEPQRLSSGFFRFRQPLEISGRGPAAGFAALRGSRSRMAFYTDDPASSVAVVQTLGADDEVNDVAIITNGKPDGSIRGDYPTMGMAALLPALFAERAERAFVIGFGTGVTVGELSAIESMERVVVAEISPGVIEAGRYFESHNQGALGSPKTEVVVSDAYRALKGSSERFDVIVSEPSNPWVAGVEMLFSREFLEVARDRLRPGGVYAQWFHLYEVDDSVVELVLRTYMTVFDRVAVWFTLSPDVILLGFNDARDGLDLEELERRVARPEMARALERSRVGGLPALLAHELLPLGVVRASELEGEVHTLYHPVLNHRAARAFFVGKGGDLPALLGPEQVRIGRDNSLLGRYLGRGSGTRTDEAYEAIASQLCGARPDLCATVVARWSIDRPESDAWRGFLDDLRKRSRESAAQIEGVLPTLRILLGEGELPAGRLDFAEVQRITSLYEKHYHHAVPFDRDVLVDVWRRCKDRASGVQCTEGRRQTERTLGPLRRESLARVGE